MTLRMGVVVALLTWTMSPRSAVGQEVRAGIVYESYGFDEPIPFSSTGSSDGLSEFSIPVVVGFELRDRFDLVVSSGYASLESRSDDDGDVSLSTILDTEVRITYDVLPQRLTAIVSGVLPTGLSPYERSQLTMLQLATNDALGISTVGFGAGGAFAVGFVGAMPLGLMAAGIAATYTTQGSYDFLADGPESLDPGGEFRLRMGVEGPVSRTGYLRVAGIVSRRGEDLLGETSMGGSNLWSGYVSYDHGGGSSNASLYLYDSYRNASAVEEGLVVPRSNTFAFGGRWRFPVRSNDSLTPKVEYRVWTAEPFGPSEALERMGNTVRLGVEYGMSLENGLGLVFDVEGLFGEVGIPSSDLRAGTSGVRLGIQFEHAR